MKKIITTFFKTALILSFFIPAVGIRAAEPQISDPGEAQDSSRVAPVPTTVEEGMSDEFVLDFDLSNIGDLHEEYILPLTGYDIAYVGVAVVFISLAIIAVVFTYLAKLMLFMQKRRAQLRAGNKKVSDNPEDYSYSGDINAAIAMALHLYLSESHDEESGVLTIHKIQRRYSPWSSKIYNITANPFNK